MTQNDCFIHMWLAYWNDCSEFWFSDHLHKFICMRYWKSWASCDECSHKICSNLHQSIISRRRKIDTYRRRKYIRSIRNENDDAIWNFNNPSRGGQDASSNSESLFVVASATRSCSLRVADERPIKVRYLSLNSQFLHVSCRRLNLWTLRPTIHLATHPAHLWIKQLTVHRSCNILPQCWTALALTPMYQFQNKVICMPNFRPFFDWQIENTRLLSLRVLRKTPLAL